MGLPANADGSVGALRLGHVIGVNEHIGLAVLVEDATGRSFKVSRRFVSATVFDRLREGVAVSFRDNGHNAVAALEIAA